MTRVVGLKGYAQTAVTDVIAEAGVSRTTFYKHFANKQSCFLTAYAELVDGLCDEIVSKCEGEAPWPSRMAAGLTAIVDRFAADPVLARTAVVEVAAAGAAARQLHSDAIARFAEHLDDGRELAADRELPANISLMSAGAVSGLIFDEVLAGEASRLQERLPDLLFAMLVPYLGPQAAAAEMQRMAGDH
jgi:AcrR family transcriptional regulator